MKRIAITLTFVVISTFMASASYATQQFQVWYYDDDGWFAEGDLSEGGTKLVAPSYACGLRINDPAYYQWIGDAGAQLGNANLSKDVIAWIAKPGCPEGFKVEYSDGSHTFEHESGGHYMDITTNYGATWVDKDGHVPACGNCVGPDEETYFTNHSNWSSLVGAFDIISASILDTRHQTRIDPGIAQLASRVETLKLTLQQQIATRRLRNLGDREAAVRALEDAALRGLVAAGQSTAACRTQTQQGLYADAFSACDIAGRMVGNSQALLGKVTFQDFRFRK